MLHQLAPGFVELALQELVGAFGQPFAIPQVFLDEERRQALGDLHRRLRVARHIADLERIALDDLYADVVAHRRDDVFHELVLALLDVEVEILDDALEPRPAHDLYAEERKMKLMEDVVASMRDDVGVHIVKGDAFQVSYLSNDAKTAMKVTERLASLFIEENLRDREGLAEGANQFLESQLDEARRKLVEHETKLSDYKRQYNGELPSQTQSNLQVIGSSQSQVQGLSESINRDRDRRLMLERMLADASVEPCARWRSAQPGV